MMPSQIRRSMPELAREGRVARAARVGHDDKAMARFSVSLVVLGTFVGSCQPSVSRISSLPGRQPSAPRELSASARLVRANQRLELSAYREAETAFRALL
jgi:hypothetical protein